MRGWVTIALAGCVGCGPVVEIDHFSVTLAEVERCTSHAGAAETCEQPDEERDVVPVVIETVEETEVMLYAADPETGDDRAFVGTRSGAELTMSRAFERVDDESGCTFSLRVDLALTIDGDTLEGAERVVTEESAGCTSLGLDRVERVERVWRGERETE